MTDELNVIVDHVGSLSCAIARVIFAIVDSKDYGVYHCRYESLIAWNDFAKGKFDFSIIAIKVNLFQALIIQQK